jgi:hypothetical protein
VVSFEGMAVESLLASTIVLSMYNLLVHFLESSFEFRGIKVR